MRSNDEDEDSDDDIDSNEENTCKRRCKEWRDRNMDIVDVFQAICIFILIVIVWLIAFSIFGNAVGPDSEPFSLLVMFGTAKALGVLLSMIKIPPIIGMIIMGVILKNVGFINLSKRYLVVTAFLRKLTLLSILLPAAFTLDAKIMKHQCLLIVVLATLPSIAEALSMWILSYYLINVPLLWSLLLGFIVAVAAPAIIIPCLFALEAQGYGNVNGIHTLITATCILDVIESVTFFGLVFGILTAQSNDFTRLLLKGPVEILIGVAYGVILGYTAQFIPHCMDWYVTTLRTIFIAGGSLLSLFGSHAIGYGGAGVLGCFCFAFISNLRWRQFGWRRHNPVQENFKLIWRFFEPISFSLIGMEINFKHLSAYDAMLGTAAIVISSTVHFGVSVLVTKIFKFSTKEGIFVAAAWIPKATVQAALGPLALDYARESSIPDPDILKYSQAILTVCVMSIVLTSPIGTIMLLNLGPKLLKKDEAESKIRASRLVLITEPDHIMRRETRKMSREINQNINDI